MNCQTKRLVLLGIGHTNAYIVKEWAKNPIRGCELICISTFPTATYSGMLPGALAGQFADQEWRINIESLCDRSGANLVLANANGIDLTTGELHFEDHPSIHFDALSIGVGSVPSGLPEPLDASSMIPIKPMQDFLKRFDERMNEFEGNESDPIEIAIVGGGVASVEIAFCLLERCSRKNFSNYVSLRIITSDDHVARGMTSQSIRKIEQLLAEREVEQQTGKRVTKVSDNSVETDDGNLLAADIVIWATGAAAPPVLNTLGLKTDDLGFIATSKTLQSLSDPRIFVVGDAGTILESPSPKAGVYAVRQSPILSHNLRAFFSGGVMKRFEPQYNFLKLLNTGDCRAILEYGWLSVHARWCWHLKTWIDKRFISQFQNS